MSETVDKMKREVDAYLATIDRLEPNIAAIDASAAYASIAISLKRIADTLERKEARETQPVMKYDPKTGHFS